MSDEVLPAEILDRIVLPVYFSTACELAEILGKWADEMGLDPLVPMVIEWAGRLHRRCRRTHKFTGSPCVCTCHPPMRSPQSRSLAGISSVAYVVDEASAAVMEILNRPEYVIPAKVIRELAPLVSLVSEAPLPAVVPVCESVPSVRVVTQTILNEDELGRTGNCLQAALATALGMDLEEVPHFTEHEDWMERMVVWLRSRHWEPVILPDETDVLRGIALGMSPRGVRHAVAVINGTQYDVHPSRDGLVAVDTVIELVPEWCDCPKCETRGGEGDVQRLLEGGHVQQDDA